MLGRGYELLLVCAAAADVTAVFALSSGYL